MRRPWILPLLLLVAAVLGSSDGDNDTFRATKDWQPIREGMRVPSGLHYRINLETGQKEAKLLDDDDDYLPEKGAPTRSKSLVLKADPEKDGASNSSNNITAASTASPKGANMEEALRNIPADIYEYSKDEMDEIRSKFRTYDEIRDQLKDVDLNVRTDFEIIKKLITTYDEKVADVATQLSEMERVLDDLEYLVHQVDNALEFLAQHGIEKVVLPNLNRTNHSSLKVKSLQLLGSALQNNPKAQVMAYEKALAEHLVRFLSTTKVETETNAALFAFSSLLRHFPLAQKTVLSNSVLNVLFGVWTREVHLKIKVKVLVLITDLLWEAEDALTATVDGQEKARQYRDVNLKELLRRFDYCRSVEQLVVLEKPALISQPDQTERVISALNYSTALCHERWAAEPNLRHVLLVLKNRYSDLVKESSDSAEHLLEVLAEINRLYERLFQYLKEKVKHEEL